MNGIGTAMTRERHYVPGSYQRTRTMDFEKALTDASGGAGRDTYASGGTGRRDTYASGGTGRRDIYALGGAGRDIYTCAGEGETGESSCEYAWQGAGISGLRLRQGEISFTSGIIGLSFVAGTEEPMSARMDKSSTKEDPVVLVQVGSGDKRKDVLIHVNEVNPESATELEMFAFLNYIDAQNGKTMASDGAWQTYNSLRNRLVETESVDNVTAEGNYNTIRVNWIQKIQQAVEDGMLRQKGWFAESFFAEDLSRLLDQLREYQKEPEEQTGR